MSEAEQSRDDMKTEYDFSLEDGAIMLDPDLRLRFPDSESVNRALRSLASQG
jgi:hypothetical protein